MLNFLTFHFTLGPSYKYLHIYILLIVNGKCNAVIFSVDIELNEMDQEQLFVFFKFKHKQFYFPPLPPGSTRSAHDDR